MPGGLFGAAPPHCQVPPHLPAVPVVRWLDSDGPNVGAWFAFTGGPADGPFLLGTWVPVNEQAEKVARGKPEFAFAEWLGFMPELQPTAREMFRNSEVMWTLQEFWGEAGCPEESCEF